MLTKIKKLKDFGIFKDFSAPADLKEFTKFNLVYGWNGAGKTTLTKLFNCLSTKIASTDFPAGEFEMITDGTSIKHTSLNSFNTPCFVFNHQFVEDNIDWKKQGAKSIIVISEEKIEERNEFLEIRDKKLPVAEMLRAGAARLRAASEKERDDFLTGLAKGVKQSFQLIDTSDKQYLNYDRTKIKWFITDNDAEIKNPGSILEEAALKDLSQKVRPVQRPEIQWQIPNFSRETWVEGEKRIEGLLKSSVVNKSIQRLQQNSQMNTWVQEGLTLHHELESDICEFCGQKLPPERLAELESHFNKEYGELLGKLKHAREWLVTLVFKSKLPDTSELYEEFQEGFKAAIIQLKESQDDLQNYISELDETLEKKLGNPFETNLSCQPVMSDRLAALEVALNAIWGIVDEHNKKTTNFQRDLKQYKHKLELHYVSQGLKEKKYFELIDRINHETKSAEESSATYQKLFAKKSQLEASLANVAKGADDFNKELQSFLGRKDIFLSYDVNEKGYRINRIGATGTAANLSEGEKTAIAFVYFVTKLTENGNKICDSIIVIDDPISSFDSNHLFHSLSFLKRKCEQSLQLFVLTHNFQYFKMVRDWMMAKNKTGKAVKSTLFTIEVSKSGGRQSAIFNAHNSLVKFGSEYQYLFKKLVDYQVLEALDVDGAYQVANYSRKLLEGFFKFKHPKERSNFKELMEAGCKAANIHDDVMNKVYKFINKYSHNEGIDFHDSPVDNLLAEGENITTAVLDIIRDCDTIHYDELMELIAA